MPAPAKINLFLHVLGRRPDGYHQLDSLVAFAGIGDELRFQPDRAPGAECRLEIGGPFAAPLLTEAANRADNLVLKAARLFVAACEWPLSGTFSLIKNLPIASGIGGGSSDAAAALRLLQAAAGIPLSADRLDQVARQLGADVPMCLAPAAQFVGGIGDVRKPTPFAAPLPAVLVNPGVEVSTPAVFRQLAAPPLASAAPAETNEAGIERPSTGALIDWLSGQRNDLEAPARLLAPVIGDALAALKSTNACRLARMSGSGATCFGLFEASAQAEAAAGSLRQVHPDWWVVATGLS